MKLIILFLCLTISVVFSQKSRLLRSDVNQDIQDFINLIPRDKIETIVQTHIANDPEIANLWAYMTSESTKALIIELETRPEWLTVRSQLESVGVNGAWLTNIVHEVLGWENVTFTSPSSNIPSTKSSVLYDMLMLEILPQIPLLRMRLLAGYKFTYSYQFRRLAFLLLSPSYQANVSAVFATDIVQFLMKDGEEKGIDVAAIFNFIKQLYIL